MYDPNLDILFASIMIFVMFILGIILILSIIMYIFESIGLYTIAKRRGLKNPWFAWVPVCSAYLTGSLSDQYQYLIHNKITYRRRIMLILTLTAISLSVVNLFVTIPIWMQPEPIQPMYDGFYEHTNEIIILSTISSMISFVQLCLTVVAAVFSYISMYDIFRSSKSDSADMFLVFSILFPITLPFFIFSCRNSDQGMPPRKPDISM